MSIKIKPANPKGVRDFLPAENARRQYIIQILEATFKSFAFENIYIPAFERYETLSGKYGEEGEKLFFKILNSGNFTVKNNESILPEMEANKTNVGKLSAMVSEKGLRYDHTVPLARFVSQHQNSLTFPFKRYVIGPVWRADRPQKGRYQEFFQCDIDIVGNSSILAEIEIVQLISQVYEKLGLKVAIKYNHRSLFSGWCGEYGLADISSELAPWIDKWDKIGTEKLKEELKNHFPDKFGSIEQFIAELETDTPPQASNKELAQGLEDIEKLVKLSGVENLVLDKKLVRGLDYYTGCVFEVVSLEMEYGSIGGGGRYDNLTELFGLKDLSGFGFSFGLDRIYDVMLALQKFPEVNDTEKVLVLYLDHLALPQMLRVAHKVREMGKVCTCYPALAKMDKQLSYSDKMKYDFVILIGKNELESNSITIKKMAERVQKTVSLDEFDFNF